MALETNLVANYRADTLNDNKGAFHLTNNNSFVFSPGKIGDGFDLGTGNTNKSASIANDLGVNGNGALGSINFWVKMNAEIASGTQGFITLRDATGLFIFQIYYEYNAGTRRLGFNRQRFAVANDAFTSNQTLGTSLHMITLTYDGTTVTGYLDASSVGTVGSTGNGALSTTDLFGIGFTDTNFASAIFDEISVWNTRAISGSEITTLYNGGLGMYFDGSLFVSPVDKVGSMLQMFQ